MKKALQFLMAHGYWLMGIGMGLILTGLFMIMEPANRLGPMRLVSRSIAVVGVVLYVAGRVLVSLERRRPARTAPIDDEPEAG